VEIVSEPDLGSPEEASEYLKALRDILMALGVCSGNMEVGSFRCDANVSVMEKGAPKLGTRTELKNINSFRFVREALDFEIKRQIEIVGAGGAVEQETRLFDPDRGETRSMRSKEDAHDYRYFPEPDLPPVRIDPALVEAERARLPELPRARAARYQRDLGLPASDAAILVGDVGLAAFFDGALAAYGAGPEAAKKVANWTIGELSRLMNETGLAPAAWKIAPGQLAATLQLLDGGAVNGAGAKVVVEEVFRTGAEPAAVVEARGLAQV
jgi:aspartyl-tRNA(Asn)/glutamyl-tRNA(Gln) amidotransferase subunit B